MNNLANDRIAIDCDQRAIEYMAKNHVERLERKEARTQAVAMTLLAIVFCTLVCVY